MNTGFYSSPAPVVPAVLSLFDLLKPHFLTDHGDEFLYRIPSSVVIDLNTKGLIQRWSKNRPEDLQRIQAISEYSQRKGYVEGIIYLAFVPSSEGVFPVPQQQILCCYDGNHRRLALSSSLAPTLISILWNPTLDSVIAKFNSINQAISVPLIYMGPKVDEAQKIAVLDFVARLAQTYPKLCSSSRSCHLPNFNRDELAQNLWDLCLFWCTPSPRGSGLAPNYVMNIVWQMNENYKCEQLGFRKMFIRDGVRQKCEKHGLWLFASHRGIEPGYFQMTLESKR